ncbi:hypothetical protein PHYPSEUDO_006020 [Phytophthora pseudosyringae]|uniref:DNA repair protein XRCC4 n=1 Tax=Phytophthora pseudosyringae TaxID=221518 RepID=A0A8T1VJR4_9STRA|nr:hypothetical protein PHYPSEUDO_006020 [Phytophthora pseudosyringae]
MSLAELVAFDADASSAAPLPLFVRCSRASPSSSSASKGALRVQLLDPPTLYEAEVAARHKPRALACSGAAFVHAVETALGPATRAKPRFEFRWSRRTRALTLMERAEFAMKFCALEFAASESGGEDWRELLREVAAQQREDRQLIDNKCSRVAQLETLLGQKEALLETALSAKQQTEDRLVRGFCRVLNAKKDEIRRLQDEADRARDAQSFAVKPAAKRKPAPKTARKKTGAKLKREEEEEQEDVSDESSKQESDESMMTGEDEDEGELKRAKREAVKAYSQLPSNLRPSSMQISSAEDLLSSMDDIIKNEEEEDAATQRGDHSRRVKDEPEGGTPSQASAVQSSRARKAAAVKSEPTPAPKPETAKPTRPAPPPVDEPMDSEEEDILDMLS